MLVLGEVRGKSMGETEKNSLYLDHPPIFFYSMCSLVAQQGKCYLHSRSKG